MLTGPSKQDCKMIDLHVKPQYKQILEHAMAKSCGVFVVLIASRQVEWASKVVNFSLNC